ncbi:MAG: hypothetical protein V1662_00155 [Candidatus Omnitrophota bacterium]
MILTDWIIAIAAIINVIVYILLWGSTKKSIEEMQKTTEFFFVSEVSKKWTPERRTQILLKNFPALSKKYVE